MKIFKKVVKSFLACFTKSNPAYRICVFLGLFVRVVLLPFLIPNVFELIANAFIVQFHFPQWLYEIVIRLILLVVDLLALSNIFYYVSFWTVGCHYKKFTAQWWGSLCYTLYYTAYMVVAVLIVQFFEWWVIGVVGGAYILFSALLYFCSYRLKAAPDDWIGRAIFHFIIFAIIIAVICLIKHFLG